MPELTAPMSVDDADDRCLAGNRNAIVDEGGVVDDTNVWQSMAMRELVDDVGFSGLYLCLAGMT